MTSPSSTHRAARLALVLLICLLVPACKSKVSKANFDQVKEGMSLAEVEKLLGKGTKDEGDGSNVAGQFGVAIESAPTIGKADVYKWESGNKTITISFRQDRVVRKDSSGL